SSELDRACQTLCRQNPVLRGNPYCAIMEHQRVLCITSASHEHSSASSGTTRHNERSSYGTASLETGHGSTEYLEHSAFPPVSTILSDISNDIPDVCMHEGYNDDSALSACSSTSHIEDLPSPSSIDMLTHLSVNSPAVEHAQSLCKAEILTQHRENLCTPNDFDLLPCTLRRLSRACHSHTAYDETFLQLIRYFMLQLCSPITPSCISYHEPVLSCVTEAGEFTPSQQNMAISIDISEKNSCSESEYSCLDVFKLSNEFPDGTRRRYEANSHLTDLGKWGPIKKSFHTAVEPRYYECPLMDKKEPPSLCAKRFRRSGHLRRHITTVHVTENFHCCKVCPRSFSRRDNLREHYWTHLKRDGSVGRNTKMSLLELSVILGPKETQLVKRLQARLESVRANETKAKLFSN
ncbi:hypothetical protein PSV08DRAFT_186703, partial [Bipolaris maydis]